MADLDGVRSIIGNQTTAGAAEETVLLSLNGAAAAATVAVPAGMRLVISDLLFGGGATASWRVQQTTNGAVFFDIALANTPITTTAASPLYTFKTPLVIQGGATAAFRVRVTTAGGAAAVVCTIRATEEA